MPLTTNAWKVHLNVYRKQHSHKPLKECMQEASKTYQKKKKKVQPTRRRYRSGSTNIPIGTVLSNPTLKQYDPETEEVREVTVHDNGMLIYENDKTYHKSPKDVAVHWKEAIPYRGDFSKIPYGHYPQWWTEHFAKGKKYFVSKTQLVVCHLAKQPGKLGRSDVEPGDFIVVDLFDNDGTYKGWARKISGDELQYWIPLRNVSNAPPVEFKDGVYRLAGPNPKGVRAE